MQFIHANLHRVYGDTCNCINHFGVPDGGMSLQSNWHLCAAECRLAVPATVAQRPMRAQCHTRHVNSLKAGWTPAQGDRT